MSALAMILTAAMVVPGDGPTMESGEVVQLPQPLNLRECWWEGFYQSPKGRWLPAASNVLCGPDFVIEATLPNGSHCAVLHLDKSLIDEGNGKLSIAKEVAYLGIYKQEDDRVIISLRPAEKGYPTKFGAGDGQSLLILHRVKPRK